MNKSILILFAAVVYCSGQGFKFTNPQFVGRLNSSGTNSSGGGTTNSYLLKETFEAAGYDNSWTASGATIDPDCSTTGLSLEGSQCLHITTAGASPYIQIAIAGQDEAVVRFRFRRVSNNSGTYIMNLRNGSTSVCSVTAGSGGALTVVGNTSTSTVGTTTTNTSYYVWLHYLKGTGANAQCDVGFSTDTTRPTTGDNFTKVTGQTATTQASQVRVGVAAATTANYYVDEILVSSGNTIQ